MNKSYLTLLEPLVTGLHAPKRIPSVEVKLRDGSVLQGTTVIKHDDAAVVTVISSKGSIHYPSNTIKRIIHKHSIVYPDLPGGINPPDASDPVRWVSATLRAAMADLNTNSISDHGGQLMISVSVDPLCRVVVTVTDVWSEFPGYVRHKLLELLWDLYSTSIDIYGAPADYKEFTMRACDYDKTPVAVRTPWKSWVHGGPDYIYREGVVS